MYFNVFSNILRWQVFNGLFIARYFLKYLVQNSKEIEIINQFELQTGKSINTIFLQLFFFKFKFKFYY